MNLTALETFYEEKRPFFLEGKHIFDFQLTIIFCFIPGALVMFLHILPEVDNVTSFSKNPESTTSSMLLNWQAQPEIVFLLVSAKHHTERKSQSTEDGEETFLIVEPLTNFLVGTIQKQLIRVILSSVPCSPLQPFYLNDPPIGIPSEMHIRPVSFSPYTKSRDYFVDFKGMG